MLSTEMNWEVVQDFLNVSGIKGVALIDGHSRPYFKGIEKVLNSQQREALAQGVWQVLETIPENFDSFEFQFAGTQVYIHKMTRGLILLVLTHDSLLYPDYCEAFTRLKAAFEADGSATLESFRRLLGSRNTSQALTPDSLPSDDSPAISLDPAHGAEKPESSEAIEREIAQDLAIQNGQGSAAFTAASSTETPLPPASDSRSVPQTVDNPFAPSPSEREQPLPEPTSAVSSPPAVEPSRETRPLEDTLQDLFDGADLEETTELEASASASSSTAPNRTELNSTSNASIQTEEAAIAPSPSPSPAVEPLPSMAAPPDPMGQMDFVEAVPESAALPETLPETLSETPPIQSEILAQLQTPDSEPESAESSGVAAAATSALTLADWVEALNCLGQCAVHYLGRAVVANYWRTSRPDAVWISTFDIERSGKIKPSPALPLGQTATAQQQGEMRDWTHRFADRCGRVIRDFPQLAETQGLSPEQRQLLDL